MCVVALFLNKIDLETIACGAERSVGNCRPKRSHSKTKFFFPRLANVALWLGPYMSISGKRHFVQGAKRSGNADKSQQPQQHTTQPDNPQISSQTCVSSRETTNHTRILKQCLVRFLLFWCVFLVFVCDLCGFFGYLAGAIWRWTEGEALVRCC